MGRERWLVRGGSEERGEGAHFADDSFDEVDDTGPNSPAPRAVTEALDFLAGEGSANEAARCARRGARTVRGMFVATSRKQKRASSTYWRAYRDQVKRRTPAKKERGQQSPGGPRNATRRLTRW